MKLTIGRDIYLSCLITLVEQIGELCESKGYIFFFFFFFPEQKKINYPMVQQLFFLIIESRKKVREIEKKMCVKIFFRESFLITKKSKQRK